jgi:hypothetical protein
MGTLTGQYVADGAWIKANEATGGAAVRWTAAEALRWLNNGQREIVNQLPKSFTKRMLATPTTGTRQDFSTISISDGLSVIDVPANFNSGGTVRGRAMTRRERAWLDDQNPTWHSQTASEAVHWMYDPNDPKAFYIYPAVTGGGKLEIIYSAVPADLGALTNTISLDDIYANALEWFILFSFYSKDASYTKSGQNSAGYWQLFLAALGVRNNNLLQASQQATAKAAGATGAAG